MITTLLVGFLVASAQPGAASDSRDRSGVEATPASRPVAPTAALPKPDSPNDTPSNSWSTARDISFWVHIGAQYAHVADHAARNHGALWPLSSEFNASTLYAYVLLPARMTAYFLDAGPLLWIPFDAALAFFAILGHLVAGVDTPQAMYDAWTNGQNAFGASSPLLGRGAQGIIFVVIGSLMTHLAASVVEGLRDGFTVFRTPRSRPPELALTIVPAAGHGAVATAAWIW